MHRLGIKNGSQKPHVMSRPHGAPGEHTGLAILAFLGILAYPVAILTWAPGISWRSRAVGDEVAMASK